MAKAKKITPGKGESPPGASSLFDNIMEASVSSAEEFNVIPSVDTYTKVDLAQLRKELWKLHSGFLSALKEGEHLKMENLSREINIVMKAIDEKIGSGTKK